MVGQTVGKYKVLDRIGRGGMGTVYRALDEMLDREVAIKVLNAELGEPEVAKRFRAEAITVARLNHRGIATVYELFQHDGQWLMAMEFVRGETLERLVKRLGPLSPARAVDLCIQALEALAHAHSLGVVHRDLKPANLMIAESGSVKIMDFGIARVAGSEHLTMAGFMMGTPAYMAPEQVLGQEIDPRTDLYALGCVFYFLTTAKLPFKGDTPMAMAHSRVTYQPTPVRMARQELPPWIDAVVNRALAKAPEQRFQTADQFATALRRGLAGMPVAAESAPRPSLAPELAPTIPLRALSTEGPSRVAVTPPKTTLAASVNLAVAAKKARELIRPVPVLAAAVLIAGALTVFVWFRSQTPSPAIDRASDQPPASGSVQPAPPATPVPPPPTASPTVPSGDATRGAGAATGSATSGQPSTPPATGGAPLPSAEIAASRATGGRGPGSIAESPAFPARRLVGYGNRVEEENVVVAFAPAQVQVFAEKGGVPVMSMPYASVKRATYVRAKNPQWDATLAAPPSGLDAPGRGFLGLGRPDRHWLALQSSTAFLVLRLDDSNWRDVLAAVETQARVRVSK